MDTAKRYIPRLVTLSLVVAAAIAAYALLVRYSQRPWTRDAQVRADIIKVAPRVEGYIVEVAVEDNQFVHKGDLLFEIDPSDFQLAVDKAEVSLDEAREDVEALEAGVRAAEASVRQRNASVTSAKSQIEEAKAAVKSADAAVEEARSGVASAQAMIAQCQARLDEALREAARAKRLADSKAGSIETAESKEAATKAAQAQLDHAKAGLQQAQAAVERAIASKTEAEARLVIAQNGLTEAEAILASAVAGLDQAKANLGDPGDANVRIRSAKVALDEAKLKLSWTKVYAPTDGYVSNLYVKEGTYAVPRSPLVAFVDSNSFRVHGYFEETKLRHIEVGNRAVVTLMGHRDQRLEGVVESIGYATNPPKVASTEGELGVVPQIQPTFDWVRLAQRVPVRIRLTKIPDSLQLISGTTASISIEK